MQKPTNFLRQQSRRIAAVMLAAGVYFVGQLPQLTPAEQAELAARYRFTRHELPELPGRTLRTVRGVHPSLDKICAWISSVGASVAMNDIDNDGLPNDISYVDPRTDLVLVTPAPGTPTRYATFALDPAPLPYDTATMAPMGTLPGDYNEDGVTDILVYYWGRTPVIFLGGANPGGTSDSAAIAHAPMTRGSFTPVEVAPTVERWFTNCATTADLDGDGHQDLVIGNYFPDGAHILDTKGTGTEQMQHSMSQAYNGGRNRLLLWSGAAGAPSPGVRFTDASDALEDNIAHGWTLAVGAADLDNDLLPEIYFANDFGPDRLMHNLSSPGHLKFAKLEGVRTIGAPKSKVLGHDSFKGMGVDFADLNGDDVLDIYVSNIAGEYALEESHFVWMSTGPAAESREKMRQGIAPYEDRSEQLGLSRSSWGWDTRLADFDNDGASEAVQALGFARGTHNRWPELHELATGNDQLLSHPQAWLACRPGDDLCGHDHIRFYSFDPKHGRYFDVAEAVGLGRANVTRGIATADVDGDGRLDMAVANQWDTSFFYHNVSPQPGSFLGLHLLLPIDPGAGASTQVHAGHPVAADRAIRALGVSVTLHLPDGRTMLAKNDGGNGHSGKRSADVQFGLGSLPVGTPVKATLAWRDRAGRTHSEELTLTPGWQTIVLGSSQSARVQA